MLCIAPWGEDSHGYLLLYNSWSGSCEKEVSLIRECLEIIGTLEGSPLASISWDRSRCYESSRYQQGNSYDCGIFTCATGVDFVKDSIRQMADREQIHGLSDTFFGSQWNGKVTEYRDPIAKQFLHLKKGDLNIPNFLWLPEAKIQAVKRSTISGIRQVVKRPTTLGIGTLEISQEVKKATTLEMRHTAKRETLIEIKRSDGLETLGMLNMCRNITRSVAVRNGKTRTMLTRADGVSTEIYSTGFRKILYL